MIEDDPAIAAMYQLQLELDGYQVAVARDGEQGLELMKSSLPDLVLLDIRLPGMDGLAVLKEAQKEPSVADIPVVVLSNYGDASMVQAGRALGARDYLIKSRTTPSDLSAQLPRWMRRPTQD
jgi:DNA-binding response OmpR family regulator